MSDSSAGEGSSRGRDFFAFVVLWLPCAWLANRLWFLCDDAFISFRYARNWAAGNGVRYNVGDHVPVEGYSNFLWVGLGALIERLGLDQTTWVPRTSAVIATVLLFWVFRLLRGPLGVRLLPASLATLALGLSAPFAVWSTSGLETMAFAALFCLTFERTVLRPDGIAALSGGLAALALALMRVEGAVWAAAFGVLGVMARVGTGVRLVRPAALYFAILGVGFGAYLTWRSSYYGALLPNTALVKAGDFASKLGAGRDYVATFALTLLTPIALLFMMPSACARDRWRRGVPVLLTIAAVYAYAVAVGGDFMTMGRLLVPALALQAIVLAWFLSPDGSDATPRWRQAAGVAVLILGALPAFDVHLVPESLRSRFEFRHNHERFVSEWGQWRYMRENTRRRTDTAQLLATVVPEGGAIVCGAIGVTGFYTGAFIHDTFGLVSRAVAEREETRDDRSPGHQKKVHPTFFAGKNPDVLAFRAFAVDSESAGDALRKKARQFLRQWRRGAMQYRYAPRLLRFPGGAVDGRVRFLCLIQRLDEGVDSRKAWADFDDELEAV